MKTIILFALLFVALIALAPAAPAQAHSEPVQCEPAPGSTVAAAPAQLSCTFSEELQTRVSTLAVYDASGTQVDRGDSHVDLDDPDHKRMLVSLDVSKMTGGAFTVKWHSVSAEDQDAADGSFTFNVGSGPATGGAAVAVAPPVIHIIAPVDSQIVPVGDVKVQVAIDNFPAGGRWDLYVDGSRVSSFVDSSATFTATLSVSGPHEIRVSLPGEQQAELASATINVEAAPTTPRSTAFNLPWMAPAMGVMTVLILLLILLGLRIARRPVEL